LFTPNQIYVGQAVAVDNSGRVFVTGYYTLPLSHMITYLTLAYSASNGRILWTNRYSGPATNGAGTAIAVDSNGHVLVTGYSQGTSSGFDYATIAYSNAGVPLWTNRYNGPGNSNDFPRAVAVDSSGNVFVTGNTTNSGMGNDYATVAYSSAGAPLWTNCYNGPGNGDDRATAIAVDSAGNVFVTGYSTNGTSGYDYATIAYSGAGVPLWTNRYNGPGNGNDHANSLTVDASGNVFVTGDSFGGTDVDYATIAYTAAGVPLWTNRYSGPVYNGNSAKAVAVDGNGNVLVTGSSNGGGTSSDFATVAYSGAGALLWTARYNSPSNDADSPTAIAVDPGGNIFVTGISWVTSNGTLSYEYATVKYSSSVQTHLDFQLLGNQLFLSWTNDGFYLQSASAPGGPFTNVPGATSPYISPVNASQQYFRLSAN
jgi:hypothetical protein